MNDVTFKRTEPRLDAVLKTSEWLGPKALTVYTACASALRLATDTNACIVECGVAEGETAAGLVQIVNASGVNHLPVFLFDTFGTVTIAARNNLAAETVDRHARPVHDVMNVVLPWMRDTDDVVCTPGLFRDTLPAFNRPIVFLHADGDLFESTCDIISLANRCVVRGGIVVFDDYGTEWTGVTKAVDEHLGQDWFTYAVEGYGQLVAVRTGPV